MVAHADTRLGLGGATPYRRPDPPYLEQIYKHIPPPAGDPVKDQAVLRAIWPPIDFEQWERCRSGMCEHHSPQNLLWSHLLKQQPQSASNDSLQTEMKMLKTKLRSMEAENITLREALQHAEVMFGEYLQDDCTIIGADFETSSAANTNQSTPNVSTIPPVDMEEAEVDEETYESAAEEVVMDRPMQTRNVAPREEANIDPSLRASPMTIITNPTTLSTPMQLPRDIYAVVFRDEKQPDARCEVRGVFSSLSAANRAAHIVLHNETLSWEEDDVDDKAPSDNPWISFGQVNVPQRQYSEDGEVRLAIDDENEGLCYAAVFKTCVDIPPTVSPKQTEMDIVPSQSSARFAFYDGLRESPALWDSSMQYQHGC
jgi:hypothetical protein